MNPTNRKFTRETPTMNMQKASQLAKLFRSGTGEITFNDAGFSWRETPNWIIYASSAEMREMLPQVLDWIGEPDLLNEYINWLNSLIEEWESYNELGTVLNYRSRQEVSQGFYGESVLDIHEVEVELENDWTDICEFPAAQHKKGEHVWVRCLPRSEKL
jgi:hypothetical protein